MSHILSTDEKRECCGAMRSPMHDRKSIIQSFAYLHVHEAERALNIRSRNAPHPFFAECNPSVHLAALPRHRAAINDELRITDHNRSRDPTPRIHRQTCMHNSATQYVASKCHEISVSNTTHAQKRALESERGGKSYRNRPHRLVLPAHRQTTVHSHHTRRKQFSDGRLKTRSTMWVATWMSAT